ncbi:MAG: MarR family transcriptional regulator [Fimbriimonadia bacterium]|jgi:DNA-binding transcriptional regulator GbsR (MarR family)
MSESSGKPATSQRLAEAQELFILEWGRMSSSWGINRTMAQIHALLYITGEQMTMDEIIERLRISRGNASMNLRELMAWGMVHRYKRPGDRKDVYFSESDVWHMFSRVVRERKRREVDPTVSALRDCLALVRDEPKSTASQTYETRVRNLLDVFALLDTLFRTVITDDDALRVAVEQGAALHGVTTPRSSD